jgi:hypothetical protein
MSHKNNNNRGCLNAPIILKNMNAKELIQHLEILPQNLPVRVVPDTNEITLTNLSFEDVNNWVYRVECSNTGESGYEYCGEIRIIVQE